VGYCFITVLDGQISHNHMYDPYVSNCRASHTRDALRVGGVRGCQAEEFVLAAQVWYCRAQSSRDRPKV